MVEIHRIDTAEELESHSSPVLPFAMDPSTAVDSTSLNNFLSGSDCIQGVRKY